MTSPIPAHDQTDSHKYTVHYPAHAPRPGDPHYPEFEAYRRRTHATAQCAFAVKTGNGAECKGAMELHHSHIEFSFQNGVDFKELEKQYPGISNPNQVGSWIESAENLEWLCEWHHRGHGGKHVAAAADYEGEQFVRNLIS